MFAGQSIAYATESTGIMNSEGHERRYDRSKSAPDNVQSRKHRASREPIDSASARIDRSKSFRASGKGVTKLVSHRESLTTEHLRFASRFQTIWHPTKVIAVQWTCYGIARRKRSAISGSYLAQFLNPPFRVFDARTRASARYNFSRVEPRSLASEKETVLDREAR